MSYTVSSPREYTTKDGQEKTYWQRLGTAFPARDGNGMTVRLNALPLPDKKGEVVLVIKQHDERQGGQTKPDLDDEIPF